MIGYYNYGSMMGSGWGIIAPIFAIIIIIDSILFGFWL